MVVPSSSVDSSNSTSVAVRTEVSAERRAAAPSYFDLKK